MTRCGSLFRLALEMKAVRSEEIAYPSTRYIRWSTLIWPRRYLNPGSNQCGSARKLPRSCSSISVATHKCIGQFGQGSFAPKYLASIRSGRAGSFYVLSTSFPSCYYLSFFPRPCRAHHATVHSFISFNNASSKAGPTVIPQIEG